MAVTVDEVKAHLRIQHDEEDGFILSLIAQAQAAADPATLLMPVDSCFAGRPMLALRSLRAEKKIRNGAALDLPTAPGDGEYRLYGADGAFLALGRVEGRKLTAVKSFFEV